MTFNPTTNRFELTAAQADQIAMALHESRLYNLTKARDESQYKARHLCAANRRLALWVKTDKAIKQSLLKAHRSL